MSSIDFWVGCMKYSTQIFGKFMKCVDKDLLLNYCSQLY